jgi:L-ornithine N5-oxygenase
VGGGESVRIARNLVVAAGGVPHIPVVFQGIAEDSRVLHSSAYLDAIMATGLEARDVRLPSLAAARARRRLRSICKLGFRAQAWI